MPKKPCIHPSVFIAPNATVLGDVTLEKDCSVFFGAVIRGDRQPISIGCGSNVQDNCVLHVDPDWALCLGENVTVGHGAILHGCTVGDGTLIGMGAIVLNGAMIGKNCLVAAGALVSPNTVIPDGSLVVGVPGKVRRALTEDEIAANLQNAAAYVEEGREYRLALQQ
ncbi:MAG: gamma carbonic anhydrase family protein [Oscillospiraceae bacterium]|nr:gamma carbonic anhydrase family protein [Oscillospiraceae bacterium]